MSYYGWKPYVSVADRRKKAEKAVAKAQKSGKEMAPVAAFSGALAKTFWGKAWCDNLERYSDYANRLPRGRTYVRNGSVIDLQIGPGGVRAQVVGSSLYKVEVAIRDIGAQHWGKIAADCSGSVATLVELLQGKLSKAVMERISRAGDGMFPAPQEIDFRCTCPDWAAMCKHVAAVLYGIGKRLDQQPELLFTLRGVDAADLIAKAGSGLCATSPAANQSKVLDSDALADVFGIELAGTPVVTPTAPKKPRQSKAGTKSSTRPSAAAAKNATVKQFMPAITLYGIRNCDSMKKAFAWLDERGMPYEFHDYKKAGVPRERLVAWCKAVGWKTLLNTKGTTWRRLTPEQQNITTQSKAVATMMEHPSVIRRPVVETAGGHLLVGFDPTIFASFVK